MPMVSINGMYKTQGEFATMTLVCSFIKRPSSLGLKEENVIYMAYYPQVKEELQPKF